MAEREHDEIICNLRDAGCREDTIAAVLECECSGELRYELALLQKHRKCLLDDLHKNQKRIDCLDYLIFKLEKNNCKRKV